MSHHHLSKMRVKRAWLKRQVSAMTAVYALMAICVTAICGVQQALLPHLRKQGAATQLVVDGKPFLVLGGELELVAKLKAGKAEKE